MDERSRGGGEIDLAGTIGRKGKGSGDEVKMMNDLHSTDI